MADFKIQRGVATILVNTASITITAGTEYTAPSALTAGFIRIVSSTQSGATPAVAADASSRPGRSSCYISNPGNLLTSIIFTRADATATATAMRVSWEIWEYIGTAGAANEFIVRAQNTETMADGVQTVARVISGVVTAADLVVFITGQAHNGVSSGNTWSSYLATSNYLSGSTSIELDRDHSANAFIGSWAAVEFTGSNWTVQRIAHTFVAVSTNETETLTDVGAVTRTMTHPQLALSTNTGTGSLNSMVSWVNSTTQATFFIPGATVNGRRAVLWVISNSQTDGTPMAVQQVSASRAAQSASPDSWNDTITAVADTTTTSFAGVTSYSDSTTTSAHRGFADINPSLTNTTTVGNWRGRHEPTTTYRYEVVEWPTVAAGGAAPRISYLANAPSAVSSLVNAGLAA